MIFLSISSINTDLIYLRIVSIRRQRPTIIPVKPAIMTQPKTNPGKKSGAGTSSISKKYFILPK